MKASTAARSISLKARALRFLARREHSRAELAHKLAEHAPDPAALDAVLDGLQAQGWLSDERYAEGRVRQRAARLGNLRLRAELQSKGVSPSVVAAALAQAAEDESGRAQAWWERKFGQAPLTPQERSRQLRHLLSCGYSAEVVQRVVPQLAVAGKVDD